MFKQFQQNKKQIGIIFFFVVIGIALLLRFVNWIKPETSLPLLTQIDGMIHLPSLEKIDLYTKTPIILPKQTFGSSLYVVGVYPKQNDTFPAGTVALVYLKDNERFMEIQYRPGRTLTQEIDFFSDNQKESVVLSEDITATLVRLREKSYCKNSPDNKLQICQMTRVLLFEQKNEVMMLFIDGQNATDGELIKIARSMLVE